MSISLFLSSLDLLRLALAPSAILSTIAHLAIVGLCTSRNMEAVMAGEGSCRFGMPNSRTLALSPSLLAAPP
ncbi:hypothetical protein KFK09_018130 [Dendrobium nobile]|uniref:Uncharacterized protein n=1 Tax=Dendrobium nobile TaxID=94219 RepID=A0A8T3AW38_DENNO|nr:hypothetical protein KFK09_018130 [Dendrobium nobile]